MKTSQHNSSDFHRKSFWSKGRAVITQLENWLFNLSCPRMKQKSNKWNYVSNVQTLSILHAIYVNRWLTINEAFVNFVRNAMQVTNVGPNSPAVLYLSEGGRIENLGILPLLKLRLTKIVSVEGSRTILDEDYGASLLIALDTVNYLLAWIDEISLRIFEKKL